MAKVLPYRSARPMPAAPFRWWNSRGLVLVIGLTATFTGVRLYAGPSAGAVTYRLLAEGLLALVWLACATGAGALVLLPFTRSAVESSADGSRRSASSAPPQGLLWFVTACGLGLGLLGLCVLGLGLAGLLNRAIAVALLAIGAVAGVFAMLLHNRGRNPVAGDSTRARHLADWWRGPAGWGWAWLVVVPMSTICVVGTMVPPGLLWKPDEPHGYDVVEYHLQVPREWYEARRIVPLRHNAFSFFPFNTEMHYLLAMHLEGGPYEAMYLVQLMHLAMIVLVVLAACGFAAQLAGGAAAASVVLAGITASTLPWLTQLGAIAYNEGGFLLHCALSVGWATRAVSLRIRRPRDLILPGAFAGFACGAKLTAVPEVLIAVPLAFLTISLFARWAQASSATSQDRITLGPILRAALLFGLTGILTFSPWLVRNQLWIGNPVFPEAASILGKGYFSDAQFERWHRAHSPQPEQRPWLRFARDTALGSPRAEGRLPEAWRQILAGWQFGYVLVPLGLVAIVITRRRATTWFLGGLLLLLTAFWLTFTHLQGRFFLLAVPLCVMLVAQVSWGRCFPAVLALVILAAFPGWLHLHRIMVGRLYGGPGDPGGLVNALARLDVSWLTADLLEGLPPDATLYLVGDAKAYWYPISMTHLHYRTVFDANTSGRSGIFQAWVGPHPPADAWLLIDAPELQRFEETYQPFPRLQPPFRATPRPVLVRASDIPLQFWSPPP